MVSPRSTVARRAAGLTLLAGSAVALSGCISITAVEGVQRDVIGDVQITTALCQGSAYTQGPTGRTPSGRVPADPCITTDTGSSRPLTVFVSYLVPTTAEAPATLQTAGKRGTGGFTRTSADDSTTLTESIGAPAGYAWVSYRSASITNLQTGEAGPLNGTVTANFKASGVTGNFAYAQMVGWRWGTTDPANDPTYDDSRPVHCGSAMSGPAQTPDASCEVAISPLGLTGVTTQRAGRTIPVAMPSFMTQLPLSRLTVTAPEPVAAQAGTTARVEFPQTSSLAEGASTSTVPVTGRTSIAGATVTTPASLTIGSTGGIAADITVPATTPAGSYRVELEVGEGSGLRQATATLKVSAAPVSASPTPTPSPAVRTIPEQLADSAGTLQSVVQRAKKVSQLRKGAATVPVQAPAPGLVRVSIVGRTKVDGKFPVIAVGSKTTAKAGRVNVTIKRTPDGREILRSGEPVEATLVVRLFYRGGKVVTTGLPITLD